MSESGEAAHEYRGGCLCGAVRFKVTGRPIWTAFCHCESCRRATGSAVSAYAGYAADRFEITTGKPSHFNSSPGVRRGFCADCGSALTYEGERWPGEVHVHIGCLDEPEAFPPQGHAFADTERISWLHIADIPKSESDG
jgi:hypothetical protein